MTIQEFILTSMLFALCYHYIMLYLVV